MAENDTKFIVSFIFDDEFLEAVYFCFRFNLKVSILDFLDCKSIILFDLYDALVFGHWLRDRFLVFYYWF